MAKKQVDEIQASKITIDETSAVESINKLEHAVKGATNEWHQMESQLKRSGDEVGASEAKYKGLSATVEKQESVLNALRDAQSKVDRATESGSKLYDQYGSDIAKAERKLTSLVGQQEKAKRAYELQESGINSLNKEIKQNSQELDSNVERLKAEGKQYEANEVKRDGLNKTIKQQTELYEKQSAELKRMTEAGDASETALSKQRTALNRTGKELAENKHDVSELNSELRRTSPNPFVRLTEKIKGTNKQATKTHSIFKAVFTASILSNVASSAWTSMTMHIGDAVKSGNEYLEQQDKMNAQWKTLAGSDSGAKSMVKGINELATSAQNSAEMVNGLASQFYAVDKNKDHVLALSKATLTLQDAFGASDDAIQNFGQQWSQMMANGKVSAQDFMSFTNVFPALKPALLDYEKDVTHNSSLTMKQLNDMISQGKISSETMNKVLEDTAKKNKEATKNFGATIPGMTRTITSTMPKLIGEIEKPFYKMKNPLVSSISTWVTDKNTTKEFGKLGKALTQTLSDITEAFGGNKLDAGKVLDGVLQGLTKSVQQLGKWTKTHKTDIKEFFSNFKEKSADTIKVLGSALQAFATITTPIIKLMAEHPKVAGTFIAGFMIANKLTAPIAMMGAMSKATKGMYDSFKDSDGIAHKGLEKLSDAVKATGRGIKRGLKFTASIITKGAKATFSALGTAVKATGRGIKRGLKFTASIVTKGAKLAMTGLVKTAKATGKGIKLAFNFLKANPLILLVTAITAVVVAFTELYKHNKKFRNFVNSLVKSAKEFAGSVVKWFKNAWNGITSSWNKFKNSLNKAWHSFMNAIAKAWSTWLNGLKKTWTTAWNLITSVFSKIWKGMQKLFIWYLNNFKKNFTNVLNTLKKLWTTAWNAISKVFSKVWNGIKKVFTNMANWLKKTMSSMLSSISRTWNRSWGAISKFFSNTWNSMKRIGHDAIWSIKNTFDNVLNKIKNSFSNTWSAIKKGFKKMWDGMKTLAKDGINAVIKLPNKGIDGINGLIHDFGGSKHAIGHIPTVHFATGTGVLNQARKAIDKPTLAVLNDGNDSPETNNQEMLVHPNGASELVEGRNTQRILAPGTEVLSASETAMLMGMKPVHFAGGTGWWSSIKNLAGGVGRIAGNAWSGLKNGVKKFTEMFKFITNAVAHPVKTLEGKFNPQAKGLPGIFTDIGAGFFKKSKNQAKSWWKTLWAMANEASEAGADGGFKGNDYRWKNRGADSGSDPFGYFFKECVSFVASRLANLGVSSSKFSHLGDGRDWVNAPVRHMSKPKVGSVAVYGAGSEFGNHVAMVTGVQGNKISGEEYNWNNNHAYHTYRNRNASGATTFLDFGLSGGSNTPAVKTNSPLAKLIKKQTGGMFNWIKKFIAPLNDSESGGVDGNVQSWSDDVKKALSKLNLSTSSSMVQRVLRQINTESGGNPKAIGGTDGLADGRATGLMQVKPTTFSAYALAGHNNIMNGYDNLLAGLNYAKHRYGSSLSFLGNGHGYENGGIISTHGLYEVAEKNMPEMVIPLSAEKHSRANELLAEANTRINGQNDQNSLLQQLLSAVQGNAGGDTYEININVNADVTPTTLQKIQKAVEDGITRKTNAKKRAFG